MCSGMKSALLVNGQKREDALLFEVVKNLSVVSNKLGVGLDEPKLHYNQHETAAARLKRRRRTVGIVLNSLTEPNAGSPTASFARLTGGLGDENIALAMYGFKTSYQSGWEKMQRTRLHLQYIGPHNFLR